MQRSYPSHRALSKEFRIQLWVTIPSYTNYTLGVGSQVVERSFSLFKDHNPNELKDPGNYHQRTTKSQRGQPDIIKFLMKAHNTTHGRQSPKWPPMVPLCCYSHLCVVASHNVLCGFLWLTAYSKTDSTLPPILGYDRCSFLLGHSFWQCLYLLDHTLWGKPDVLMGVALWRCSHGNWGRP